MGGDGNYLKVLGAIKTEGKWNPLVPPSHSPKIYCNRSGLHTMVSYVVKINNKRAHEDIEETKLPQRTDLGLLAGLCIRE